jgi:hypothetical protein
MPTASGPLAGTLLTPPGEGPWPVTLILAGSGPTDRDGNLTQFPGGNNSLRQLAEALAAEGVASLRVDKRGVGGSAGAGLSEFDLRFDDFIADAVAWCRRLQADPRFTSLTVVGHSQGAQVGMNAAWLCDADGFAALCGPGFGLFDLLRAQLAASVSVRTRVKAEEVLRELEQGRTVDEPSADLMILLRPSVQQFLISWNRHDPLRELARLPLPVLVVQGTTDIQVTVEDAEQLAGARPGSRLLVVDGMNHVLKMVARENTLAQQTSYVDSTLAVAPEVSQAVADLVRRADGQAAARRARRAAVQARALAGGHLQPIAVEDSLLRAEFGLSTAAKMGRWARRFAAAEGVSYLFGTKAGGYVAEGDVVSDRRQDCVSLLYRAGELARARDAQDAVAWALRTRLAGAATETAVTADGRLDYDDPAHLDYSLDMIRTGLWGRDITPGMTGAAADTVGSARYAPGSFTWVPKNLLKSAELAEGDVVWFVLDAADEAGARLRREHGLVIGHIGLVIRQDDTPWLVHAASSDLEGWYAGGTVVKVPLVEYLARVDRFAGVMVTRF